MRRMIFVTVGATHGAGMRSSKYGVSADSSPLTLLSEVAIIRSLVRPLRDGGGFSCSANPEQMWILTSDPEKVVCRPEPSFSGDGLLIAATGNTR